MLSDDAVAGHHSISYHFAKGKLTPSDSSGVRHSIEPTEVVYLRFYLKLSPNWSWTNKPYGPHLLHFMTTENNKYHGPAASHLTLYIEPVNGKLRLAAQDIQNKDMPHGLTQGPLEVGYNGRLFDSQDVLFDDGKWHCVEAMFKLNSLDLARDRPNDDGELRGWVDGKLVIERTDVVFRSTDFPRMRFDQFMILPYFHDGVPHDQTLWIDERAVGTKRIGRRLTRFLTPAANLPLSESASYPAVRQNLARTLDHHHHAVIGQHLRGDGNCSPPRPGDGTDENRAVIRWTGKLERGIESISERVMMSDEVDRRPQYFRRKATRQQRGRVILVESLDGLPKPSRPCESEGIAPGSAISLVLAGISADHQMESLNYPDSCRVRASLDV